MSSSFLRPRDRASRVLAAAAVVIPGHGAAGTTAALTHTIELLSRRPAPSP